MKNLKVVAIALCFFITCSSAFAGNGTVKFFNSTKGFGYIMDDETHELHLFTVSGLIDQVKVGDDVEFNLIPGNGIGAYIQNMMGGNRASYDVEEGPKGTSAINVKVV